MLSLEQELFSNTKIKVPKKVQKKRIKVRRNRKTKTFIYRNKKNPSEKFVVKFDLNQIKKHLSGKAKPSDKFVVVKRVLNNKVVEHFDIEHFAWFRRAARRVSRGVNHAARRAAAAAKAARDRARRAAEAAKRAAAAAARRAREAAERAARAAREAARRAKEAAARAAREAARKAKEIAEKAKNAVKKGLDSLGGLSASQIRKLTAMFKKQQQALEAGRKAQQAAAERAQKAQWAEEERRDAAERARMEAELAKGKKDDTIKTPLPKFEDKDVKEINVGKGMSKDLGDSNKYKSPSINTKMDVTLSTKSQEFEKVSNPDWEDFMNIGPTQSFKISYIVIILLLIFLYYTYTK
jgi:hypothetical protein